jgi:hypothetical protein
LVTFFSTFEAGFPATLGQLAPNNLEQERQFNS